MIFESIHCFKERIVFSIIPHGDWFLLFDNVQLFSYNENTRESVGLSQAEYSAYPNKNAHTIGDKEERKRAGAFCFNAPARFTICALFDPIFQYIGLFIELTEKLAEDAFSNFGVCR